MRFSRTLILALFLAVGLHGWCSGQVRTVPLGDDTAKLTLISQSENAYTYRAELGNLEAIDVVTPEGTFTRLLLPGFHRSQQEGTPELPMMNRLIEVPIGATPRIEILNQSTRSINLVDFGITHPLMPVQPSMPKSADPATWPFVIDRAAYSALRAGGELVAVQDVGQLRSVRVGRLEIAPVEYFPTEGRILVHDSIEFRITFDGTDLAAEASLKARTYSPFFEGLYRRLDGYRGERGLHDQYPDRVRDIVTMVVITPASYSAQMQNFVNWKRTRGFNMIVGVIGTPEVGSTTTSIQTYIRNLYNNGTPEQPAPSFVLFVGDVDVMPTFSMSGDASDRPYCAIDADLMPDIYYGRFSCANPTQLQNMLDKTLMYDQFTMPDPNYLGEVTMIAGVDGTYGSVWANGQINYGTSTYFNASHGILSHTYLYPGSGSAEAQIIADVNRGVSYINYTAHGSQTSWSDPTFTQSNVNSLTNAGKYCLAVGNCCLAADYAYPECFAETWLRAGNKGAIGYIGGSNSTYWDEDYWWGVGYRASIVANPVFDPNHMGAYDGVFHDHGEPMTKWYVTNDALIFCGNLAVTEAGSGLTTYYWNIYNLSGDPSISTYLGVPTANPVTHLSSIFTSSTSLTVTGVPNSYVGLTKDGAVIGAGTIGTTGNLELPIWAEPLTPGTAHIVVMAQNRVPYQADIQVVAPTGPFVIYAGNVVQDGGGDADGQCDAGETLDLVISLTNSGVAAATGISATISSADPLVTIHTATRNYPDLAPGQTGSSIGGYNVSFDCNTPDNHPVNFALMINTAQGTFERSFSVTVGRPVLAYAAHVVQDAPLGNGTGWLVPGEASGIQVTLDNTGHANACNASIVLSTTDPYIHVLQGTGTCADIPADGQGVFSQVQIWIDTECPSPTVLTVHATLTADFGYTGTVEFRLPIGGFADDAEAENGWTLGVTGDNATSGLWIRDDPVGTVYSAQVAQPEDDHTANPGVKCFVTGNGAVGGAAGDADVDGGATTLMTPVFDLSRVDDASVSYWVYYTNDRGNNPGQDYWDVQVTGNGTTWVNLEHTTTSTNAWVQRTFQLADYITLGTQVQIRFVAQDQTPASLVEALVDDFVLTVVEPTPPPPAAVEDATPALVHHLDFVLPNPSARPVEIGFSLANRTPVDVQLFDVSGALVRTLWHGPQDAGSHRLVWDRRNASGHAVGAGVYFLRMQAPGFSQVRPVVVLE